MRLYFIGTRLIAFKWNEKHLNKNRHKRIWKHNFHGIYISLNQCYPTVMKWAHISPDSMPILLYYFTLNLINFSMFRKKQTTKSKVYKSTGETWRIVTIGYIFSLFLNVVVAICSVALLPSNKISCGMVVVVVHVFNRVSVEIMPSFEPCVVCRCLLYLFVAAFFFCFFLCFLCFV